MVLIKHPFISLTGLLVFFASGIWLCLFAARHAWESFTPSVPSTLPSSDSVRKMLIDREEKKSVLPYTADDEAHFLERMAQRMIYNNFTYEATTKINFHETNGTSTSVKGESPTDFKIEITCFLIIILFVMSIQICYFRMKKELAKTSRRRPLSTIPEEVELEFIAEDQL